MDILVMRPTINIGKKGVHVITDEKFGRDEGNIGDQMYKMFLVPNWVLSIPNKR